MTTCLCAAEYQLLGISQIDWLWNGGVGGFTAITVPLLLLMLHLSFKSQKKQERKQLAIMGSEQDE